MGLLLPHSLLSSKITFTDLFSKQQAVGQCLPGMESTKDSTLPSCRLYNPGLYLLKSWRFQKQWVSGEIWCSLSICILENIHIFPCCTILSSLSARSNDIWYDPCQVQTRCSPCSPVNLASLLFCLDTITTHSPSNYHTTHQIQLLTGKKRHSLWMQPLESYAVYLGVWKSWCS